MKTLNFYVTREFLATLLMSLGILTFGLMGVNMIKVFKLMADGVSAADAGMFLLYVTPMILTLGIPWAVLVAVMLVFGKMSADNEITAMRACGVSIMQIMSPIICIVFLLSLLCLWLQLEIAPVGQGNARSVGRSIATTNPAAMFQPGVELPVDNMRITIGDMDKKNNLEDVQIYVMSKDGSKLEQDIHAQGGTLTIDKAKERIVLTLKQVTFVKYDEGSKRPMRWYSETWTHPISYGEEENRKRLRKRESYMTSRELFGRAILDNKVGLDTTKLEVELHKRLALGISPIAFLLIGLPLAVRTSRKETSLNLLISVGLAGLFLACIMIFNSMDTKPELRPQLLMWIPNVLYQLGGIFCIYRIAKR